MDLAIRVLKLTLYNAGLALFDESDDAGFNPRHA
jgi:hypothetical protein